MNSQLEDVVSRVIRASVNFGINIAPLDPATYLPYLLGFVVLANGR